MTRKKAREQCEAEVKQGMYVVGYSQYVKFLESMIDDFESRVCENCKYYKMNESVPFDGMECTVNDSGQSIVCFPPPTFGCNKFEPRDDK